jgi:hypothetical protein
LYVSQWALIVKNNSCACCWALRRFRACRARLLCWIRIRRRICLLLFGRLDRDQLDYLVPGSIVEMADLLFASLHVLLCVRVAFEPLLTSVEILCDWFEVFPILVVSMRN